MVDLLELHGLVPRETNLNPNGNENRRTLSEVPSSKILSKITKQATSHPEDVLVSEEKQKIKPSSKYFVQLTHDNIRNTLKYTPKKEQNKTQDEGLRSDVIKRNYV